MKSFFCFLLMMGWSALGAEKVDKENLELFSKVLHLVEKHYYTPLEREQLLKGALKGMMRTLDPHSSYLDKDLFVQLRNDTQGEFGGIGVEVSQKNGQTVIVTPIEDSPAAKAGILAGDIIVEINDQSCIGKNLAEVIKLFKQKNSKTIKLGIKRKNITKKLDFRIKKGLVKVSAVKSKILNESYIYSRITQFQRNVGRDLLRQIQNHKRELERKNKKLLGVILDLRSNPGGFLEEAVNVSSIFLEGGVIVSTQTRDKANRDVHYVKKSIRKDSETPLAVLINGASASASEIVAGAIQDYGRGIIVGGRSFGKGSVQSVIKVSENFGLKLTIAQYLTPKNRLIQAQGIIPDIELEELKPDWKKQVLKKDRYLRESNLTNHLKGEKELLEKQESSTIDDFQIAQTIKILQVGNWSNKK